MSPAHAYLASPLGTLRLRAHATALTELRILEDDEGANFPDDEQTSSHPVLARAARELAAYFAGRRTSFTVPLAPAGTPFQQQAWQALLSIPFGETRSYAQQARLLGDPSATRAVGAANGRNPIAILIPCHRVIGSNGTLTGYAGGLARKEFLLRHEGALPLAVQRRLVFT